MVEQQSSEGDEGMGTVGRRYTFGSLAIAVVAIFSFPAGQATAGGEDTTYYVGEGSNNDGVDAVLTFKIRDDKVKAIAAKFRRARCEQGRRNVDFGFFGVGAKVHGDGSFEKKYEEELYKFNLAGRLGEESAKGRVKASTEDSPELIDRGCKIGRTQWDADQVSRSEYNRVTAHIIF